MRNHWALRARRKQIEKIKSHIGRILSTRTTFRYTEAVYHDKLFVQFEKIHVCSILRIDSVWRICFYKKIDDKRVFFEEELPAFGTGVFWHMITQFVNESMAI